MAILASQRVGGVVSRVDSAGSLGRTSTAFGVTHMSGGNGRVLVAIDRSYVVAWPRCRGTRHQVAQTKSLPRAAAAIQAAPPLRRYRRRDGKALSHSPGHVVEH